MSENTSEGPSLIERSFADGIAVIAAAQELSEQTRRHWVTSLRQIANALGKPLELIPARYSAIRADLLHLHSARLGVTPKTLQNHRSNAKSALLWLAREKGIPEHGAPLTPRWATLRGSIRDPLVRWRLSSLMRFCSAQKIEPEEVNEAVVDRLLEYRARTGKAVDDAFRRLLARAWNANVGTLPRWPKSCLAVPEAKTVVDLPWQDFPEGLRQDVESYLARLTRIRRNRRGQRIRPLKSSTIRTRRAELQAAARMAVKTGVPTDSLTSLSALLNPVVAEKILDAYWVRNGERPRQFTIDLAGRFLAIAHETGSLDHADCEQLNDLRQALEGYHRGGLTEKNMKFLCQVLTPGVWGRVVNLPFEMIAAARMEQSRKPVQAAVTAQLAVAIAILSAAPVRLANLTAINLGTNLIKPDGPESNYWLVFPECDVKNRVTLEYPLKPYLTRLIDEYVFQFRPTLLRGRNEDWLFPGQRGGAKGKISFSGQITKRILKGTGLEMTVHQFRHAAGALILKERPGEYELVRRLLGHVSIQTTINAYIGLDNIQASEIFSELVMAQMQGRLEAAE